jgi:hypothetical protein
MPSRQRTPFDPRRGRREIATTSCSRAHTLSTLSASSFATFKSNVHIEHLICGRESWLRSRPSPTEIVGAPPVRRRDLLAGLLHEYEAAA